jgi:hypothetical protein
VFQDEFAEMGFHQCWSCGSQNEQGLQTKSYWEGEESVCTWQPQSSHRAWLGIVNGGILATILDCHCTCTAIADATCSLGLGSCWALMLVMFGMGVGSLLSMAVPTGIMVIEKTYPGGQRLSPVIGIILLGLSALWLVHPAWLLGGIGV